MKKIIFAIVLLTLFAVYKTSAQDNIDKKLILRYINEKRSKACYCGDKYQKPAPALEWDSRLEKAALMHSVYQYNHNKLTHFEKRKKFRSVCERSEYYGYEYSFMAENVAWNYPDEKAVIDGWMNSPGHCKNIMNPNYIHVAVARKGSYWTMVLGTPLKMEYIEK